MLLRALIEAEIDGVAVANQLTSLKETIDSFAKVKSVLKDILLYLLSQLDEEMRQREQIRSCLDAHDCPLIVNLCFRTRHNQNCVQLLWNGSRSCCWRKLRYLISQTTAFESSSESGVSMRYRKKTKA